MKLCAVGISLDRLCDTAVLSEFNLQDHLLMLARAICVDKCFFFIATADIYWGELNALPETLPTCICLPRRPHAFCALSHVTVFTKHWYVNRQSDHRVRGISPSLSVHLNNTCGCCLWLQTAIGRNYISSQIVSQCDITPQNSREQRVAYNAFTPRETLTRTTISPSRPRSNSMS